MAEFRQGRHAYPNAMYLVSVCVVCGVYVIIVLFLCGLVPAMD